MFVDILDTYYTTKGKMGNFEGISIQCQCLKWGKNCRKTCQHLGQDVTGMGKPYILKRYLLHSYTLRYINQVITVVDYFEEEKYYRRQVEVILTHAFPNFRALFQFVIQLSLKSNLTVWHDFIQLKSILLLRENLIVRIYLTQVKGSPNFKFE